MDYNGTDFELMDVEFMTAVEKKLVLVQWKRFLQALLRCDFSKKVGSDYGYFPESLDKLFPDRLYKHLSGNCMFIAHYNRRGFLSERFGSPAAIQETIRQFESAFIPGAYRDLQAAMLAELRPLRSQLLQLV